MEEEEEEPNSPLRKLEVVLVEVGDITLAGEALTVLFVLETTVGREPALRFCEENDRGNNECRRSLSFSLPLALASGGGGFESP